LIVNYYRLNSSGVDVPKATTVRPQLLPGLNFTEIKAKMGDSSKKVGTIVLFLVFDWALIVVGTMTGATLIVQMAALKNIRHHPMGDRATYLR